MVHHPSPTVALARWHSSPGRRTDAGAAPFVDRLVEHGDDDVRAAVLRMQSARRPDEALLRRHLRDARSPGRCTALIGLLAGGFIDDAEAPAGAAHRARERDGRQRGDLASCAARSATTLRARARG